MAQSQSESPTSFSDDIPQASLRTSTMSSPLLTPPLTPRCDEQYPFKASASDKTSLSMKKRHHAKHGRHIFDKDFEPSIAHNGFGNESGSGTKRLTYSKSLSHLADHDARLLEPGFSTATAAVNRQSSIPSYRRRWTLPTKADSTREVSIISPAGKRHTKSRKRKSRTSPALITLRRATNKLLQGTDFTYFPTPTFTGNRTSFMSALLQSMTSERQATTSAEGPASRIDDSDSFSPKKMAFDRVSETMKNDVAQPAITEVFMEPVTSELLSEPVPFRQRRCSTKYVAGSSVYEIIWDENDTPTSSSQGSPGSKVVQNSKSRRQSVAVAHLENQLYKSVVQSRRPSVALPQADEFHRYRVSGHEWSFQSMLDSSLSRLINESALWNLPRSKASRRLRSLNISVAPDAPPPSVIDDGVSTQRRSSVEVFPPFQYYTAADNSTSAQTSLSNADDLIQPLKPVRERCGHNREPDESSGKDQDQDQMPQGRAQFPGSKLLGRKTGYCESQDESRMPLLSQWDNQNPW